MSAKSKILVTGANGQLGKELQRLCHLMPDYDFIFLARNDMPIQQFELVRTMFESIKPAFCINCAAYTAVDKAEHETELAFEINGEAVGVLAAICLDHETKFIHISTDYVFDGQAKTPYKENDLTIPVNAYGASKLKGEEEALKYNPETIIIRTSWLYSSLGKNFVKTMLRLMSEKEEVNVVNDQFGSPTYAADLAEVILQIVQHQKWQPGIYHYSNAGIISWFQFALAISEISKSNCKVNSITTAQFPTPAKRPAFSALASERIQQNFQIELKDWRTSLASCIDTIKNAPK
jgi:dTDP-4-dehydrorhamnose reductase